MTNTKKLLPLLFLTALAFSSGCVNTSKFVYFQGGVTASNPSYLETPPVPVAKINQGDILAITVSSLNEASNEILNFQNINTLQMSSFPGQSGGAMGARQPLGYRVDSTGNVVIPFIGKQYVRGLSLMQASDKLKEEVEKYLKEPAVNVRFLNHKFSVLGEVSKVGTYNLLDDKTTLIEAIAMAGDLSIYGKRDSVTIIRDAQGIREIATLSLLNREIFSSPYFYVKNGDIIYVQPIKGKVTSTEQRVQLVPIFTGIATTIAVLLNIFLK